MKIYLVSIQFLGTITGGEGMHVMELAKELVKKKQEVTVLTMGIRNLPYFEKMTLTDTLPGNKKPAILKIPTYRFFSQDSPFINSPYEGLPQEVQDRIENFNLQVLGFLRAQKNQKDTIIHLHGHFRIPAMAKLLKLYTKFRIITTMHRVESLLFESRLLSGTISSSELHSLQRKELNALNNSDIVIIRSQYAKDLLTEIHGPKINPANLRVLPSAVSMSFINDPIPNSEDLKNIRTKYNVKGPMLLDLNILDPIKGHEYTIQAMPLIQKKLKKAGGKLNEPVSLFIAGLLEDKNKWYLQKLEKLVRKIRDKALRSRIRILPNIDPTVRNELFHISQIFLHTAIDEPFGITIAEAMSRSKLVIAMENEGPRLLLDADRIIKKPYSLTPNGILLPRSDIPNRVENLSEAVTYGLINSKKLAQTASRGKARALKYFSWKSLVDKVLVIYKESLKKTNKGV